MLINSPHLIDINFLSTTVGLWLGLVFCILPSILFFSFLLIDKTYIDGISNLNVWEFVIIKGKLCFPPCVLRDHLKSEGVLLQWEERLKEENKYCARESFSF